MYYALFIIPVIYNGYRTVGSHPADLGLFPSV
jgi:hypothetical protein